MLKFSLFKFYKSRKFFILIASVALFGSSFAFAAPPVASSPEDLIRPIGHCEVCPICPPSAPPRLCDECEDCPICPPSTPPTECPVNPECPPPPPPPPPEPRCELYQMDFRHVSGDNKRSSKRRSSVRLDHSKVDGLNCLGDIIKKTNSEIGGKYRKNARYRDQVLSQSYRGKKGDHLYGSLFTTFFWKNLKKETGFKVQDNFSKVQDISDQEIKDDNEKARSFINCVGGSVFSNGFWQIGGAYARNDRTGGWSPLQDGCASGSIFLDENCKLVDKKDVDANNLCGKFDYFAEMATPISLVWNEDFADKPATMVNFKLNPHSNDDVWMWRASESLPLLVYDPEHTGSITSATQLFGNWTFGGNGLAALLESSSVGTPWKDGYEALAVMDKNRDGKVSGEELKDLALWFDRNQDGISQPGEIVALSDLGVTALYYQADAEEDGALVATKGYERIVDGKTVVARSIDWREKSLRDGFDVILDKTNKIHSDSSSSVEVSAEGAAKKSDLSGADAIEGVWNWSIDLPAKGSGLLSFAATDEGVLGSTITQVGLAGMSLAESKVLFAHFEVEFEKSEDGKTMVHFTQGGSDGATMINSAILSKDKDKLLGKTIVKNSSLSNSGTYEYTWTAERFIESAE